MTGRFITFEGGEGAGKSTQLSRLRDALAAAGIPAITTREPGGSPGAEDIRGLLLGGGVDRWDGLTEALLVYAARRDHLERTIRPALARGDWVLCDRFEDSTHAYQGAGGGLDPAVVERLGHLVRGDFHPDLTLILDLPVVMGRARAAARRQGTDRFEQRGDDFHERVRAGFLKIGAEAPGRCALIDAAPDLDVVSAAIRAAVSSRLGVAL